MIIVFDTETTGLTLHPRAPAEKQPRMIEFGAVLLDRDGSVVEEAGMLCNPQEPITPEITKITGLTDADVADAPTFEQLLPQLVRLFGEASCVVAHNLPFDRAIIRGELMRLGVTDFPWPVNEFCTVQLYADEWGRNPRLIELYAAVMGEPLAQTHRALDDVLALVKIIQKEQLWNVMTQ
jgi:DNA polymerase III epsilon subunit-like protein